MAVERRQLIQILGAGLATGRPGAGQRPHQHGSTAGGAAENYAPRALTAAEYQTVDKLVDLILPADETSPGAHDAGVARYIDIVLLYGDKAALDAWKGGVERVDTAAREAHGHLFSEITRDQQTAIVRLMAANEASPVTQLELFFIMVKRLAIEAFYLSSAGKESLGYKGDRAIVRFPGCTDPEHKL